MNKVLKSWIYLIIAIIFFATIEVATKPYTGVFDPLQLTFLRFFFGGLFLLLYITLTRKKYTLSLRSILLMGIIGSFNSIISMSLLQLAVKFSNASTAALLISSNPVFVVILALFILNEKINRNKILSMAFGITGLLIISFSSSAGDSISGLIFGILASLTFALYTVLVKKFIKNIPSEVFITYSFLISSVFFYIILKIAKIPVFAFDYGRPGIIPTLIYLSVFVTGIAYIFYFKAFEALDASKASFSFLLKPIIAMIFAYYFLGEVPAMQKIIGTMFIIISIAFIAFSKNKKSLS
ncbi:MAG TPA: EamA family transporter [Tepiditoga sp.]|nr:EamA family transporter [Thermotogota bacterium]HOO75672.1 EamA family transporter [Tepiditoga sp.]